MTKFDKSFETFSTIGVAPPNPPACPCYILNIPEFLWTYKVPQEKVKALDNLSKNLRNSCKMCPIFSRTLLEGKGANPHPPQNERIFKNNGVISEGSIFSIKFSKIKIK